MGRPFPSKLPLPNGGSGPHVIRNFLGPSKHTNKTASQSVQPFWHRWPPTAPSVLILYNSLPLLPSKLPITMRDDDLHLIHGSLGPPESSTQTASWSVEPFLQGSLLWQTDKQTNRPHYSVCNDRPTYVVPRCSLIIISCWPCRYPVWLIFDGLASSTWTLMSFGPFASWTIIIGCTRHFVFLSYSRSFHLWSSSDGQIVGCQCPSQYRLAFGSPGRF